MSRRKRAAKKIEPNPHDNIVVVSDLHCGCKMGLCPPGGVVLDGGGEYMPSKLQRQVWNMWTEFWEEWVPTVTHGEPYTVVVNGDALDGVHHRATTQISHNLADQANIAYEVLAPVVDKASRYYHIRGTEAHVGPSGAEEDRLAQRLNAIPNEEGQSARHELWIRCGSALCHITHTVGTTSSSAYEATAVYKEHVEAFVEAGRWGQEPPQIVVRSHRHRNFETRTQMSGGYGTSLITAAWQLKTPFVFRIGLRQSQPQIGGSIIRAGDEEVHTRHRVWPIARTPEVK